MTHEERLQEANNAVLLLRKDLNKDLYPTYHMAPYAGWMSAPCGLVYFQGLYHVFYQHHPFAPSWGPMHWGHLTSDDLLHWRHHPAALAPGDDFDRDGCFAGSSIVHEDKLFVFYTGHHVLNMGDDQVYQVQCLAVSEDGFTFEKRGIVVKPPAEFSHCSDPRVWYQDGRWWMVCGGQDTKDQGQLLLYSTDDLEDWDDSTFTVLAKSKDRNVYMWECPDFFFMGKQHLLVCSAQGMEPRRYDNRNRYHVGTCVGSWAPDELFVETRACETLDRGHDFYSPQTFITRDGRRVMLAWLDMWGSNLPTTSQGWCGMLSIPREIILDGSSCHVFSRPIKEMELLRTSYALLPAQDIEENTLRSIATECSALEVKLTWNLEDSTAEKYGLWLGRGCEVFVDAQTSRLVLNRHYPEYIISGYRSCSLKDATTVDLHIFFDRSSVEIFINGGETTLSSRIYPSPEDRELSLFSINGTAVLIHCEWWTLDAAVMQ